MRNLNIAFIIFELGSGGQERQMSYAIKSLVDNGTKPILFVWDFRNKNIQDYGISDTGIEVIKLKGGFLSKIFYIRKKLIADNINIFQSWSIVLNIILTLSTIGIKIECIGALRGSLFGHYIKRANPFKNLKIFIQLLFVNNIVCNSLSALNDLKKLFKNNPLIKKNFFILRNRTKVNNDHMSIPSKCIYDSISCGSLLAVKNIDLIIDIVSVLKNNFPNYIHAHAGGNGNLHEELSKKIKSNKLEDNFLLLGELKSLDDFYCSGKIYIHSSNYEGTPNALIEAMSFGLPIISSDWGDADQFVYNSENGIIIDNKDFIVWADYVMKILLDEQKIKKMGEASFKIANQKLGLDNLYPDLIDIYSKVLSKKTNFIFSKF